MTEESPAQYTGPKKKRYVRSMFDSIAHRYDFLNPLLSGGIDWYWRKRTVDLLHPQSFERVLDVATGTGDMAFTILNNTDSEVYGLDFALKMLSLNKEKAQDKGVTDYQLLCGDAEQLPVRSETFDLITIAYGIRNMGTMEQTLEELYRILKPNGRVGILEFSQPKNALFKRLYYFYFRNIMPAIGYLFSGNRDAYNYLQESVSKFPSRVDFSRAMEAIGFKSVHNYTMTMGICTLYIGFKN